MRPNHLRWGFACVLLGACALTTQTAFAQGYAPRYNWTYYGSPATAASAAVHAQADFLRAYGEASVDVAEARRIHAEAYRQELINSVERIKAYWERKSIGEAELFKRYHHHLDSQKLQNSKTWERIKNHPDLTGPQVQNGTALNFLLARLSGTVLAYEFSGGSLQNPEMIQQLSLSPDTIHQLKLRQRTKNGQNLVFRADEGTALANDWWPYALAAADFENHRFNFSVALDQVKKEASENGRITPESIQKLDESLFEIKAAFDDKYTGPAKTASVNGSRMQNWSHYNTGKRFLQSLAGEVGRLATTQKASAFDGSLKFEGDNLVALLTYMSRSGLDFAPAEPGDEQAYHRLFAMMRDIYVIVAENDPSIKPVIPNPNIGER